MFVESYRCIRKVTAVLKALKGHACKGRQTEKRKGRFMCEDERGNEDERKENGNELACCLRE